MSTTEILANPWFINISCGIIVGLIVGLILYYVFGIGKKQEQFSKELNTQSEKIDSISLMDSGSKFLIKDDDNHSDGYKLVKKIGKEPPYLQQAAEDAYVGQHIDWPLLYQTMHKISSSEPDKVRLLLCTEEGFPWIVCEVNLNDYPWLKTLTSKSLINVSGDIKVFHGHDITLINVKLSQ